MSVKYCKKCGAKNSYIGIEPKFCSSCGAPLNQSAKANKTIPRGSIANSASFASAVNSDDTTNVDYVPHIGRLQYDVDSFDKKTFTFEEIAQTRPDESRGTKEEG